MAERIQIRRGTAAQWLASDPVLAHGELAFETDTFILKAGDSINKWSDLPNLFSGNFNPIKVKNTDFASATAYDNSIIVGRNIGIFLNQINRYLEDEEWQFTATGINILIPDFDATSNVYTFFITFLF